MFEICFLFICIGIGGCFGLLVLLLERLISENGSMRSCTGWGWMTDA